MKKILLASLLAVSALGLQSCNNGDYDVNPATTASGTNPLNTGGNGGGGGGGSASGTITCKVDGVSYSFTGNYSIVGTQRSIGGGLSDGTTGRTISVISSKYTGPGTYDLASVQNGMGSYGYFPMSNTSDVTVYSTAAASGGGSGTLTVSSDDNNTMKGTFSFTAPKANGSGAASQVVVTEGTFNVAKQ